MSNKMDAAKTLLPKLRFPEFQGEWDGHFGNQLFDPISNKDHDSSLPVLAITQEHGAIPRDLIDYQVSVTETSIASYKVVEVGDFIISLRSFQGGIEYSEYKGICSPAYIILRKKNELSETYFKYFFKTDRFIQQLQKNLEGLRDGKMVSYQQFSELLLPTPSTAEQQKIADCLTSLDDLIAAQSQKVEALQTYKKGLMQNLFPVEGESVPRLRLPEFQSAGEWEEKVLGKAATFYNGRAYKQEELLEHGKYRVLRVGNFFTNNNWYYSDLELDETKYCENGDLLYAWSASFGPRIWQGEKVIYHYHIWKVVAEKNINKDFLHLVLDFETEKIRSQSANGLGLLHITKGTIENWKCLFPKDPNEQQRIADLLNALDKQISVQVEVVAALKDHKKGLMQQLFPSEGSLTQ